MALCSASSVGLGCTSSYDPDLVTRFGVGDLDTKNTVEVMDLLLAINQELKTTCVMVTHNPDLECYADRVLYIEDGQFVSQAINAVQTRLDYDSYLHYLNSDA